MPGSRTNSKKVTSARSSGPVRQRRSSDELRTLILDAARKTFAEKGYAATTKRDIAEAAEVSLSVLHRHFESMADLFAAAALTPFTRFLDELTTEWLRQREGDWDDEAMMRSYLGDLFHNLTEHREVLTGLVSAAKEVDPAVLAGLISAIDDLFTRIGLLSELEAHRRQWFSPEGLDSVLRILVAMVLGTVTYDWLLIKPAKLDPAQVLDDMVHLALWGLARHPPSP